MGALAGASNDLAGAALRAGCDVVLHCTGRIGDNAALLAGCPALDDRAAARLAAARAVRDALHGRDAAGLRALRDAALVQRAAAGDAPAADPTERDA
jgi:beta-N-acetylhexosaminidase